MNSSQQFFTKYRFPLFFLLSYLLSWWLLPVSRQGMLPQGPAFAAVIVIALTAGAAGLRVWWQRLTNFRAGWLYLVGPAIVIGCALVAFVVNARLGAAVGQLPQLPTLALVGELVLFGGQWEEPGWSGYALPTLQHRFAKSANGPLIATLIVGIFRGIWHLPLVLVGTLTWYDAFLWNPLALQVIISWLYNKSGGRVPAVMVFHFASNLVFAVMKPVFVGPDLDMYRMLSFSGMFLVALALAWRSGLKLGWRGEQDQAASGRVVGARGSGHSGAVGF